MPKSFEIPEGKPRADAATRVQHLRAYLSDSPVHSLALLAVALSFFFMVLPGIDVAVSRWFWDGSSFPLERVALLEGLRDLNRIVPYFLLPAMLATLAVNAFGSAPRLVRPHKAAFVIAFYALGPGLLVHVLKAVVGRARPSQTLEFGGTLPFSPAWQISDACVRNCSFPSGEAASAFALVAFALILPAKLCRPAVFLILPFAILCSINRIAFGKHFLSDVVLAWALAALPMVAMWSAFRSARRQIDAAVIGAGRRLFERSRAASQ